MTQFYMIFARNTFSRFFWRRGGGGDKCLRLPRLHVCLCLSKAEIQWNQSVSYYFSAYQVPTAVLSGCFLQGGSKSKLLLYADKSMKTEKMSNRKLVNQWLCTPSVFQSLSFFYRDLIFFTNFTHNKKI